MSLLSDCGKQVASHHSYDRLPPIRKLFSQSTEDCDDVLKNDFETFQVYLRIKPNLDYKNTIKIVNGSKLICKPPITSKMYKCAERSEFTFSKIFGPETTQKSMFEETVLPCVTELIRAHNSLIFSYGTTNAGKTYTIQGDTRNPGLIPRTLHALFSRINPDVNIKYAPHMATNIRKLSMAESVGESLQKEDLLKLHASARFNKAMNYPELNDEYNQMSRSFNDYSEGQCSTLPTCSVWVSFIELYNELIYDLLDPCTGPLRKQLKLSTDKHHNYYVKGLKQFCVQNAEEAYNIYLFGKRNLNVACTKMNENSSRSHCIFVIKLINQSDPEFITISSLSICDLAGTERQTKTQNTGVRLKEAGNINLSLFTLNRCLKTLRENQMGNTGSQVIPYRSSKLTQLLCSALLDKNDEKIIMIVNINPSQELYDETQQVLKICAIACEIRSKPVRSARIIQQRTRFSSIAYEQDHDAFAYQPFELEMTDCDENKETIEEYLNRIEELEDELKKRDESMEGMHKQYQQMLKDSSKFHEDEVELMRKEFDERMERRIKSLKEYYEWKLQEAEGGKPETKAEIDDEPLKEKILELEKQVEQLQKQATNHRKSWNERAEMKQEIMKKDQEIANKDQEIATLSKELEELSEQYSAYREQNKVLQVHVNHLEGCERELQLELENKEKELEDKANHILYLEKSDKENKKKKRLDKKKKLFNPEDNELYSFEERSPQIEVLKETRSKNEIATPAQTIKSHRKKKLN